MKKKTAYIISAIVLVLLITMIVLEKLNPAGGTSWLHLS